MFLLIILLLLLVNVTDQISLETIKFETNTTSKPRYTTTPRPTKPRRTTMKKIMSTFPFFGNFSAEKIRYLVFTTPPPTTPVPEMRHLYAWGHLNLKKARSVEPKDVCNYADNTLCNQHNPTLECTCLKVPGKDLEVPMCNETFDLYYPNVSNHVLTIFIEFPLPEDFISNQDVPLAANLRHYLGSNPEELVVLRKDCSADNEYYVMQIAFLNVSYLFHAPFVPEDFQRVDAESITKKKRLFFKQQLMVVRSVNKTKYLLPIEATRTARYFDEVYNVTRNCELYHCNCPCWYWYHYFTSLCCYPVVVMVPALFIVSLILFVGVLFVYHFKMSDWEQRDVERYARLKQVEPDEESLAPSFSELEVLEEESLLSAFEEQLRYSSIML